MRPPRFSIAGLLAFIGVTALGFSALRFASKEWENLAALTALLVLAVATLGAWTGRRASWAGFAAFGWSFVVLIGGSAVLEAASRPSPPAMSGIPAVPSTPLAGVLDDWYPTLYHAPPERYPGGRWVAAPRISNEYAHFQRVGHILACLLFGLVGAVVGSALAPRVHRPRREEGEAHADAD